MPASILKVAMTALRVTPSVCPNCHSSLKVTCTIAPGFASSEEAACPKCGTSLGPFRCDVGMPEVTPHDGSPLWNLSPTEADEDEGDDFQDLE